MADNTSDPPFRSTVRVDLQWNAGRYLRAVAAGHPLAMAALESWAGEVVVTLAPGERPVLISKDRYAENGEVVNLEFAIDWAGDAPRVVAPVMRQIAGPPGLLWVVCLPAVPIPNELFRFRAARPSEAAHGA